MSHTIAAVSTGNQVSAIGIIRMTGDDCIAIANKVFTLNNKKPLSEIPDRKLMLGDLHDKEGRVIDSCCAIYTRGPHSYTGEDTVEFHCHGSPAVLAAGLEALYCAGAKPAKRGEFTKRAFLNGQLDLTQAEAVIDLIEADTADAAANDSHTLAHANRSIGLGVRGIHEVHAGKIFVARHDSVGVFARYTHEVGESGTRAYEDALETHFLEFLYTDGFADDAVFYEFYANLF